MVNRAKKQNVSIQQILAALLDDKSVFPPAYLRHFSDLEDANLAALTSVWPQASPTRRFTLLEDLEDIAEIDTLVSFDNVAMMALKDEDPRVRTVAVRLLWETENPRLAGTFLKMLEEDPSVEVRAAAATALGLFIYLGELEEVPEELHHQVEERLLVTVSGAEEELVRRRALESLGFSGRKEVPPLIRKAYESDQQDWLISSLFAMGRSADNAWSPEVTRMLRHPQTRVQMEAVQAAGELELETARRPLLKMLDDELQDSDLRASIYWALSKIGGEDVRETLEERLEQTEDEEEAELIEEALMNLDFTEEMGLVDLMEFQDLPDGEESAEEYLARRNARTVHLDKDETDLDNPASSSQKQPGSGNKPNRPRKPG